MSEPNAIERLRELLEGEPMEPDIEWSEACADWLHENGAAVEALYQAAKEHWDHVRGLTTAEIADADARLAEVEELHTASLRRRAEAAEAQVTSKVKQISELVRSARSEQIRANTAEAALATTRQALAAYRSALRSGEPETDELRALADTDSDTAGRCPGNLPASSCCGAPDGECIHP